MRVSAISVLVCACVLAAAGDVAQLKTAKARLLGKLARHHKRGVLSAVPPYKLGHDIPHVHHSVIKPLVVTYPPTAVPVSVKVPLTNPLVHRWPVPVGHRVPAVPHPHFGLKFPHKTFGVTKPDNHFHHHHHHIARPVVPVVPATPAVPVAQPSIPVAHPVPAPPPVLVQPAPVLPVSPPPLHVFPPHFHVKPAPPALAAPVAVQPPVFPAPQYPAYAPQLNYVIRPGTAVQTSYFATYPRYPLVNYQTPIVPVAHPSPIIPVAAPAPPVSQVFLERPAQLPHYHLFQQAADQSHGLVEHHGFPQVQPSPPLLHAAPLEPHPTALLPTPPSVHVDHNGWSPVQPTTQDLAAHHYQQEQAHQLVHEHHQLPQEHHQVTQEQVPQVYEHHDQFDQHDQYHELQLQLQQQLEHAQYEQHARDQQLAQEYGQPQQDFHHQQQDYHHQQQDFHHQQQEFHQQQQDFHQQQEYQGQQEYAQPNQEYGVPQQQLNLEYGAPQHSEQQHGGFEGRSSEGDAGGEEQQFRDHIPLRLQPPIDRPLEHFR